MSQEGRTELKYLLESIDHLAERYGWSKNEVLSLPTRQRNWFVKRVSLKNEKEAEANKGR